MNATVLAVTENPAIGGNKITTVVLDESAVNALFPEGSDARVKLASAAVKALGKSVIKPANINTGVISLINSMIEEARKEVLKSVASYVQVNAGGGNYKLNEGIKNAIKKEIDDTLHALIAKTVEERAKEKLEMLTSLLPGMMEKEARRLVGESLKQVIDGVVKSAEPR